MLEYKHKIASQLRNKENLEGIFLFSIIKMYRKATKTYYDDIFVTGAKTNANKYIKFSSVNFLSITCISCDDIKKKGKTS